MQWYYYLIIIVISYILGNWFNALFIAKLKKINLREQGSGNPGTMNMIRVFGKKLGILNFCLDMLKGALPALLCWGILSVLFGDSTFDLNYKYIAFIAGFSAIIGTIYPIFYKFKGGKGIATTMGVLFAVSPMVTTIAFICGLIFIIITHHGALTSFLVISAPLIYQAISITQISPIVNQRTVILIILFLIFFITFIAHHPNIKKLFLDNDRPVILFKKKLPNKNLDT